MIILKIYIVMILKMADASYNVINDQTRFSELIEWRNQSTAFGVVSKLCPLGTRYYIYPDSSKIIRYFLAKGELKENNLLFFLIYIEISYEQKILCVKILFNLEYNWISAEQFFDVNIYEGRWFQHYIYYDDDKTQLKIEIRWDQGEKIQFSYPYIKSLNIEFIFTLGGIHEGIHPITKEILNLQTFPGNILVALSVMKSDLLNSWKYFIEKQCSNAQTLQLGKLDLEPLNQNFVFMIDTKNLKYYRITFWAMVSVNDLYLAHQIYIIRIVANRFTSNFKQTGSNSFIIKYFFDSNSNNWFLNIRYYSYSIPLLMNFQDNFDPFEKSDQFQIQQKDISSWHYISIEYNEKNEINFSFENILEEKTIRQTYTQVNQFSNIFYRLFFGGSNQEINTLPISTALVSYYDCLQNEIRCHISCKTCFGPLSNQCLSCTDNSNRVFQSELNSCKCKLWYQENDLLECKFISNFNEVVLLAQQNDSNNNDDSKNFNEFCQFGQFSYNQNCYQCPSARQANSIICSECLMRPIDWITKNTGCQYIYHLYEININNNFVQQQANLQIQNLFFVLQNEQLIVCEGCKVCQTSNQINCFKSENYRHLDQETFIQCLDGYIEQNGKCQNVFSKIDFKMPKCSLGCIDCQDNVCELCNSNAQYFLNLNGECQKCKIDNCKYCFQFNIYNPKENSIFIQQKQNKQDEDIQIGCALCQNGYSFSFQLLLCIKYNSEIRHINQLFYFDEKSEIKFYQTDLVNLNNKFQEIIICLQLIPNCDQCIYNNLGLLLCTKCLKGYYQNNINGLCLSCSQYFGEDVSECYSENNNFKNQNLQLIGFAQYFANSFFNFSSFYNIHHISNIKIISCQNQKLIDFKNNKCVIGCQGCDNCQYLDNNYQCVKCQTFSNQNIIYSQNQGVCYSCPYPCKFCLQLDEDIIYKYNPYFIITQETKSQVRKCLINYDDKLTYIDQKSGLIKPLNNENYERMYFLGQIQKPIQSISVGTFILDKSIQEIVYTFNLEMYWTIQFMNYFYPLQKQTLKVLNKQITNFGTFTIYNITDFIFQNVIYDSSNSTFILISQLGLNVLFSNISIQNYIINQIVIVEKSSKLIIENLLMENFTAIYQTIIQINGFIKQSILNMSNVTFLNCYFEESNFLYLTKESEIDFFIENVTLINSKFFSSFILHLNTDDIITFFHIKNLKIINCTIESSQLFHLENIKTLSIIEKIFFQNVIFVNSIFFKFYTSMQIFDFKIVYSTLKKTILFYFTLSSQLSKFSMQQFQFEKFTFSESNLLYTSSLTQNYNFSVEILNINMTDIDQIYSFDQLSNNYLFTIQNSNIMINNFFISTKINIQLLYAVNCQNIEFINLFINSESEQIHFISGLDIEKIYQNQLIQISNFYSLKFLNINISQLYQLVDPLIQIRSDDAINKSISIINFSLQQYLSKNLVKSLNSVIYIQIQSKSEILIQNTIFKSNFIQFSYPNQDFLFSSLLKIKSPSSQVLINKIAFEDIQTLNSSDSVIFVEADKIIIDSIIVKNINDNSSNIIKSINGFGTFLCQYIEIKNSLFYNIKSILYGMIYVQLKQNGVVNLINCQFLQENNYFKLILPLLGGVITVDAQLSHLSLNFTNIEAKFIITSQSSAFLYLLPSIVMNQINFQDIKLDNVHSLDNSISKFNFPQNAFRNYILLKNIIINNSFSNEEKLFTSDIENQSFNSSNLIATIEFQNCKLIIKDFFIVGQLEQPIFFFNSITKLLINNLIIRNSQLNQDLNYVIKISGNNFQQIILDQIQLLNFYINSALESIINFNFQSVIPRFIIKNLLFYNVTCQNCQKGFVYFQSQNLKQQVVLINLNFILLHCGVNSCLKFYQSQVKVIDSKFLKLFLKNNGVLQFQNCISELKNIIIKNCISIENAGGIFSNNSTLTINNLSIINNTANIGGGIYLEQTKLDEKYLQSILFYENQGYSGMSNIRGKPDFLKLQMFKHSIKTTRYQSENQILDTPQYLINSQNQMINNSYLLVKSGQEIGKFEVFNKKLKQYLENNITLQLEEYNQLGEKVVDSFEKKCQVSSSKIKMTNNFNFQTSINEEIVNDNTIIVFNATTKSYQFDSLKLYLNPYLKEDFQILILVKCENLEINYYFYFYARTLPCEIGEYFLNEEDNHSECKKCDFEKGLFSVEKNSSECQRLDPKKIKNVSSSQIELFPGFWRFSLYSHDIEICDSVNFCEGGWKINFNSCCLGHLGAICNECDLYNIRGNSSYIKSFNGICQIREYQAEIGLSTILLMMIIFFIAYLIIQKKEQMLQHYRIVKCSSYHYKLLQKCNLDSFNTKIKLFIHVTQILYTLIIKSKFLFDISILIWPIGKSSKSLLYLINFFVEEFPLSIIYLKAIWAVIIPFVQISVFGIILILSLRITRLKKYLILIQMASYFFFFYSIPNIIEEHSYLIQMRTLGNKNWVGANISQLYDTDEHRKWLLSFVLPCIIFCQIIIPIATLLRLQYLKKINRLSQTKNLSGYLCSDYKLQFYYQEILNFLLITLIIFIHSVFNEVMIIFKKLLILVILFIYYVLISIQQPYLKNILNKMEKKQIFLICLYVSFSCLYQKANQDQIFYQEDICSFICFLILIIIITLNLCSLMTTYLTDNVQFFDWIKKLLIFILPKLLQKYPLFLKSKQETKKLVLQRFKFLRNQIKILRQNNPNNFKQNYNFISEDTHGAIYTTVQRSDQRMLIQSFPQIQQSIID